MKTIIFRGKRIDNNEWVYGLLISIGEKYSTICVIQPKHQKEYRIFTKTIGQFTGLQDSKGKDIYEELTEV